MTQQPAPSRRVVVVLPEDAGAPPRHPLAAGAVLAGARVGVVDNGLWRSMPVIVDVLDGLVRAEGATGLRTTPFDHLAADFDDQRAALAPFAGTVAGAVAGLGA
jgi:hypothetical protein